MIYGYCPHCGEEGIQRERRPNGNDVCANGHTYPSKEALAKRKPTAREAQLEAIAEMALELTQRWARPGDDEGYQFSNRLTVACQEALGKMSYKRS